MTRPATDPKVTPERLATDLLEEVIADIARGAVDVVAILRKCFHACTLLNWDTDAEWFRCELEGYATREELPWYRRDLQAHIDWRPEGMRELISNIVEEDFRGSGAKPQVTRDVYSAVGDVVMYAAHGVATKTGKTDSRWSRIDRRDVDVHEVVVVEKATFERLLHQLANEVLRWASRAYRAVGFGDAAGDVWRQFRAVVDEWLASVGFEGHVKLIGDGVLSDQPQAWRQAMWSCRDLLRDVAAHLWRHPGETYSHLTGTDGQPMKITPEKYLNRLAAYLHQKGVTGTTGSYLRAEIARLHALNDLDSVAHNKDAVTLEDARLAAISTYTLLGEFVLRTDMQPVEQYV